MAKLTKIDGTTYAVDREQRKSTEAFYFVEQMANGKWDAYASLNPDAVDRYQTVAWSSRYHSTRRGALQSLAMYRRSQRQNKARYVASR